MIKTIYLDFDGTFYSHTTESVPESTVRAVKSAQAKGIKVLLATGRDINELKSFDFAGVQFDGYILCNGQVILDKDENLIYQNPIEGDLKERILAIYNDKKIVTQLISAHSISVNFIDDHYRRVQTDIGSEPHTVNDYDGEPIILASMFVNNEEERQTAMSFKDDADVTYWHMGAVDIVPKGVDKAKALGIANEYLGISQENCMAVGDGENDISMLRYAGIGVAMGNAADETKKSADYVTQDVDSDGLASCFRHFDII